MRARFVLSEVGNGLRRNLTMTIAELCILIACLLPIVCAGIAKWKGFGVPRRQGGFDNHNPRQWLARLEGWQARANAAQQSHGLVDDRDLRPVSLRSARQNMPSPRDDCGRF